MTDEDEYDDGDRRSKKYFDEYVENEIDDYKWRSDMSFLECAIALMVTDFGAKATKKVLKKQRRLIDELY